MYINFVGIGVRKVHITLEADYAIRIVHCLARENQRMDAKSIAEATGVTLRFSLKILRKLVASGIVKSFKGTQGGYEIGRPLEQISLYDVIETIEGEYQLNRCNCVGYVCQCKKGAPCQFKKVFGDISKEVQKQLKAHKFSEFI